MGCASTAICTQFRGRCPAAAAYAALRRKHAASMLHGIIFCSEKREKSAEKRDEKRERERHVHNKGLYITPEALTGKKPYLHINSPAHIPHLRHTYSAHPYMTIASVAANRDREKPKYPPRNTGVTSPEKVLCT